MTKRDENTVECHASSGDVTAICADRINVWSAGIGGIASVHTPMSDDMRAEIRQIIRDEIAAYNRGGPARAFAGQLAVTDATGKVVRR